MGAFVRDPRQRHSYELRPAVELDAAVRTLAAALESRGMLERGASTAPRFQPHVTLCRAAAADERSVRAAAAVLASTSVTFDRAGAFGSGRVLHLLPADRAPLDRARAALLELLDPETVDPLATARAWTPHLSVAYAVPAGARDSALELIEAALPLQGAWACVQAWDLDRRPTRLVFDAPCVAPSRDG